MATQNTQNKLTNKQTKQSKLQTNWQGKSNPENNQFWAACEQKKRGRSEAAMEEERESGGKSALSPRKDRTVIVRKIEQDYTNFKLNYSWKTPKQTQQDICNNLKSTVSEKLKHIIQV